MNINVLLIEDNYIAQRVAILNLEDCKCSVDTAIDGKESLKKLKKNKYDLVFMDLGLPDIKGIELIKKVRAIKGLEKLPVIALTAHDGDDIIADDGSNLEEQCLRAGMNGFYTKPLISEQIYEIISKFASKKFS